VLMFLLVVAMTLQNPGGHEINRPATIVHDDPAPWRSPAARALQMTTVVLAGIALWYHRKRQQQAKLSASPMPAGTLACPNCRKLIPETSRFCRRCGAAV
jgi:hypothetical protein